MGNARKPDNARGFDQVMSNAFHRKRIWHDARKEQPVIGDNVEAQDGSLVLWCGESFATVADLKKHRVTKWRYPRSRHA